MSVFGSSAFLFDRCNEPREFQRIVKGGLDGSFSAPTTPDMARNNPIVYEANTEVSD